MKKNDVQLSLRVREYTENKEGKKRRKHDQTDEFIWPLIDSDKVVAVRIALGYLWMCLLSETELFFFQASI